MAELEKINISVKTVKDALVDGSYTFWPGAFTKDYANYTLLMVVGDLFYKVAFDEVKILPQILRNAANAIERGWKKREGRK